MTWLLIQRFTTVEKKDIMEIATALPAKTGIRVLSFYEQSVNEGIEKGIEKGFEKGFEAAARKIISKFPAYSDAQIADLLDVPVDVIRHIQVSM